MIEGAIFDLDGTLLDTMEMWSTVIIHYLEKLDRTPKPGLMDALWDMSLTQAGTFCKEEYNLSLSVPEIVQGILKEVEDFYLYKAQPMPYVKNFLEQLHSMGVKMCIATASDHELIAKALKRCGMDHYFSQILDCAEAGHGKDEPIIYRMSLEHLGTSKGKTVAFEDACYALRTLKADGFYAVSIYSPYDRPGDDAESISDAHIPSYDRLDDFWNFAKAL